MYSAVIQIAIIIILLFLTIVIVGILYWSTPKQSQEVSSYLDSDIRNVRDVIIKDSYLNRLLMIEIINNDKKSEVSNNIEIPKMFDAISTPINKAESYLDSETVTFRKMADNIDLFGRSLVRSFGGAISQRITTLMHQRNIIIKDYYRAMRDVVCSNGSCVHVSNNTGDTSSCIIRPLTSTDNNFINKLSFSKSQILKSHDSKGTESIGTSDANSNDILQCPLNNKISISLSDITTETLRKLEIITREISDNIAAVFHIKDIDETNLLLSPQQGNNSYNNKRPIIHYERLFNLMTMYNKELLNQAKLYASKQYDTSMNCSQSSLDITYHIGDEFNVLMNNGININK